jgi:hypothetical protein
MAECTSCGHEIDYRDRFCSSCGAITERGWSIPERLGRSAGRIVDRIARSAGKRDNRKHLWAGGAAAVTLLMMVTGNPGANFVSDLFAGTEKDLPRLTSDGSPDLASYKDVFSGEVAEFVVTGPANVRDYPTSQGTQVINTLEAGEIITARPVHAFDPSARWYRLPGGGYVWGGNLVHLDEPENAIIH